MKITADYPLYNNLIGKLEGIEFIEKYLESLYYENEFCKAIPNVEEILQSYSKDYKNVIINKNEAIAKISPETLLVIVDTDKRTYVDVPELLKETIVTGRISKLYQISKYELLMTVRAQNENKKLLVSIHPMYARVQLTQLNYPTPDFPNALTMFLR